MIAPVFEEIITAEGAVCDGDEELEEQPDEVKHARNSRSELSLQCLRCLIFVTFIQFRFFILLLEQSRISEAWLVR